MAANNTACALGGLIALALSAAGPVQAASDCPSGIEAAQRLMLVVSPSMDTVSATVRFFEKDAGGNWKLVGRTMEAALGMKGLGWSWKHRQFGAQGDPAKTEGDGRTPAGFFSAGQPFGFDAEKRQDYVRLAKGRHYCVDDPASPHYNAIVDKSAAGERVSGEEMGAIPQYRQGLFLDYPTNRDLKGGSCIFVHVWRGPGHGTAGCVALAESDVKQVQAWSVGGAALVGMVDASAWARLRACFKGL